MFEFVSVAALMAGVVVVSFAFGRKVSTHMSGRRDARLKSHIDWMRPTPRRRSRLI